VTGGVAAGAASAESLECPTHRGELAVQRRYDQPDPLAIVSDEIAAFRQRHPEAGTKRTDAFMANDLCIVRVDDGSKSRIGRSSSGDNLAWKYEGIFFDGQHHYAVANWDWVGQTYIFDWTYMCLGGCTRTLGGDEGIGIALNRKATIPSRTSTGHPYSLSWYSDGTHFSPTRNVKFGAAKNSALGVGFAQQDVIYAECGPLTCDHADYTMANGGVLMFFDDYGAGCHDYQAFFKYGHTWEGSSVIGFSIGQSSIGFTFSSQEHRWTKSSLTGTARLC
jgi:hypothetical protein